MYRPLRNVLVQDKDTQYTVVHVTPERPLLTFPNNFVLLCMYDDPSPRDPRRNA